MQWYLAFSICKITFKNYWIFQTIMWRLIILFQYLSKQISIFYYLIINYCRNCSNQNFILLYEVTTIIINITMSHSYKSKWSYIPRKELRPSSDCSGSNIDPEDDDRFSSEEIELEKNTKPKQKLEASPKKFRQRMLNLAGSIKQRYNRFSFSFSCYGTARNTEADKDK